MTAIFVDDQAINSKSDHSSLTISYEEEAMNISALFQFEDLPAEILIEIFQYLSTHELYSALSHLNTRLNSILQSLPNLILIATSHCDPVLFFFKSFGTIQIHFNRSTSTSLSQFNFSHFVGIRSFLVYLPIGSDSYVKMIEQVETFICPNVCPQLQSLRLPFCSQRFANSIFSGAFPHLKICHFYEDTYSAIVFPTSTTHSLSALRQFTVLERKGDEFEKILLLCPNLTYLDFSCDSTMPLFVRLDSPYLSLKRLRLSRITSFLFHNGHFESLLFLFPNLVQLDLTVDQCQINDETIDFDKMAHYLRPRLNVLELRIFVTLRNRSSFLTHTFKKIAQMHPLFKCFGKDNELLHIASFDFTSIYYYNRRFVRPSSE
jgi:hypothetical protein